jgi:hypothetical protein
VPATDFTITFPESWKKRVKVAAQFAVGAMAKKAEAYCRAAISLDDHTLRDLARLDHPYAQRHGPNGLELHDPNEQIHTHRGVLLRGLTSTPPSGTASGVKARVYNRETQLDRWIQAGTSKMIARPYMAMVRRVYGAQIVAAGRNEFSRRAGDAGAGERSTVA